MKLTSSIKRMTSSIRRSRRQTEALRQAVALPLEALEGRTLLSTVATDDVVYVAEDGSVSVNLLANDTVAEGAAMDVWMVDFPLHGPWSLDPATGGFTYTPDANFNGTDQFNYWIDVPGSPSNVATVTIHVTPVNDAPVLATIVPPTGSEGSSVAFAASATDVDAGDVLAFSLEGAPAGAVIDPASGAFSWTPMNSGEYAFDVVATDAAGATARQTVTMLVTAAVPQAYIVGAPASAAEGSAVDLGSALADPSQTDVGNYVWTVTKEDGSTFATGGGTSFSFTPDDNGVYVVNLQTTDGDGDVGSDSVSINVTNVAPSAFITNAPAVTVDEGSFVSLGGDADDAGSADTLTYSWSVTRDDVLVAAGTDAAFVFTPDDEGAYVVRFVATDDDGGSNEATATINVANVAPTANIEDAPATGDAGVPITLLASAFDPGFGDTMAYAWTVTKNGSPFTSGSGQTFAFTPDDAGDFGVQLTVSDGDGGAGAAVASVQVLGTTIGVQVAVAPAAINEFGMVTLTGAVSGGNASGGYSVLVEWSDGSSDTVVTPDGSFSISHKYRDDNASDAYVVSVVATDAGGHSASAMTSVSVYNVAPTVQLKNLTPGTIYGIGSAVQLSGRITDVGALDTHTAMFQITSPDIASPILVPGTVGADGVVTASYSFASAGTYHVSLTVSDDDGGTASTSTINGVNAYLLVTDMTRGYVLGNGSFTSTAGSNTLDPAWSGLATLNTAVLYQSDGTLLGTTEFQFGSSLFRSTTCDSVNKNGTRAQIQGSGTINGTGSYRFRLVLIDGGSTGTDRVRMRIWNRDTGNLVYDNQMGSSDDGGTGSTLTAGSIVIA
jgi:large repetitive protein